MRVRIFDVEHGACALVEGPNGETALIDCGTNNSTGWTPADYLCSSLGLDYVDYLIITNADQDHYANLADLSRRVEIGTLITNPSVGPIEFEAIKRLSGPLSRDAQAYKSMKQDYNTNAGVPFDNGMGGVGLATFYNPFPEFVDTNNLSLACFVRYGSFQMLFPGDLEEAGWLRLLQNRYFKAELQRTTVLVASHHGRKSGYCDEVFDYCRPRAVVVSDKPIIHMTQEMVPQYQNCVSADGVNVVGVQSKRHVLTTRRDGCIRFDVQQNGNFSIYTRESWKG